jgi:two-component system phosphate regulon sensor histidine kinase PhoR
LHSILDNALDAFETYRHQRSVELSVDMPRDTLRVMADRGAVSDALLNLLTNAYKYGGDPVKVRVTVEEGDKFVKVKVTDNGAGIPATEHTRIFQKFYRVDDRLSREREGSGLGLAIVKHVMKAHKGRVELVSHPGKGSTFALVLPRAP